MKRRPSLIRWLPAVLILAVIAALFTVGLYRLQFDTDILNSMPQDDPVLLDGRQVFLHHPIQDRVAVDIAEPGGDVGRLTGAADLVVQRMRESGLFRQVGFESTARLFPELLRHIAGHLPVLFSETELDEEVRDLLEPKKVRAILESHLLSLGNLEGIGQADLIAADPLGLRNLILSRLADLAPAEGVTIHQGHLLSQDQRHLLIVAEPLHSGMDTRAAREIADFLERVDREVKEKYGSGSSLALTPVGAYRAALDNEDNARSSVKRAVLFATAAISLLLLVSFSRPLIGLLALLPAFAGTMAALFVYSLFYASVSLMAVGFGGAIIAFAVDYGLTYLLFLDRSHETRGEETSREVWNLGLLAMLTTAVSFAFLSFSGFPALVQIGQFAALGIVFTFLFVHLFFPLVFPVLPPAGRPPILPLRMIADRLAASTGLWKTWLALGFALVMLFFARPVFHVDPAAMNAVTPETIKAEQLFQEVWGDIFSKTYLLVEGTSLRDLQEKSDRLALMLAEERRAQRVARFFLPSLVFPGERSGEENFAAWQRFWDADRRVELQRNLENAAGALGFAGDAFEPFLRMTALEKPGTVAMPERFARFMGASHRDGEAAWYLAASLVPGPAYDGAAFFARFSGTDVRVFDPALFGERFGSVLMDAFLRMAAIVGSLSILVTFLVFLDWRLTLIAFLPTLSAMICTLGTLNLLGVPLGIPLIMVSVVVIGMGTDYALYLVRSYQRYQDGTHPSVGLVRQSMLLAFATTFLGVAVLALSDHVMLRNAGLGLVLGIGYSFLGALMIGPPLLHRLFAPVLLPDEPLQAGSKRHVARALMRYRHLEAYPRLFARFKIALDSMFPRLARFPGSPRVILDIGTGYGVPAVWLLELHPGARLYGIEPDAKRVAVASRVIGSRGSVMVGGAPDLPDLPEQADTALLLDMIHLIPDDALRLTLDRIRKNLSSGGTVVVRATVPTDRRVPWKRWIEEARIRAGKGVLRFRTEKEIRDILEEAGFSLSEAARSAPGEEEIWFVAHLLPGGNGFPDRAHVRGERP